MVDPKKADAETTFAASVEGGQAKEVAAVDLVPIPYGAPHFFKLAPGAQITYVMPNLERSRP